MSTEKTALLYILQRIKTEHRLLGCDDWKAIASEALSGNASAQYIVAMAFEKACAVEIAREWYERAAAQGYSPALARLLEIRSGSCSTTNRRRGSRIEVKPLVYLTKTADTPGFLLNLSEDGMAIQAMEIFQQGRRIEFQFPLPKTKVEISGAADVMWCDSVGRAGLKVASIGEFDRFHLNRWITETQAI